MTLDRKDRYSRRALLKALGLGLGVLPLLESDRLTAAPSGVAKRFISITWTNGIVAQNFYPPAGPLTAPLPPILSPLEPWKSKVLAMHGPGTGLTSGIDIQVMIDANLRYGAHFSYPALLTGCVPAVLDVTAPSPSAELASIDVLIGNALQAQGFASPRLNLGCRPANTSTSWSAGGVKNQSITNPYNLYATLFGGTPDLLARRQSVLDFCIDDLARFGSRLGSEDKPKIDSHLQSLRAIEMQLGTLPGCHPPAQIPTGLNFNDNNNYPILVKSMMDMIAAAVKCDVARTFTLDLIDDGGGNSLDFSLARHPRQLFRPSPIRARPATRRRPRLTLGSTARLPFSSPSSPRTPKALRPHSTTRSSWSATIATTVRRSRSRRFPTSSWVAAPVLQAGDLRAVSDQRPEQPPSCQRLPCHGPAGYQRRRHLCAIIDTMLKA